MSALLDQVLDPVRLEQCQQADRAESEHAQAQRRPVPPDPRETHYKLQAALAELEQAQRQIKALRDDLALLRGERLTPQAGCFHYAMNLDEAEVVVEFEYEPEDGDGWNTPHYPASITPLCVFINGKWCDVQGTVDAELIQRWTKEVWQRMDDERDAAAESAAEARAEDRRMGLA